MDDSFAPFFPLIPLALVGILAALAAYFLAPRVGANKWLWVIGCLIPIFNFFFVYYVGFRIIAHVLDRLNSVHERLARPA